MPRIPCIHDGPADDRAVSEVLGAILIFALVLILVVLIQVAAVPALNQQIEFAHNQRVQGDMQLLDQHVDYTAATGAETSTTIEMGVYYPTRIFLLNPPPAPGSLTTTETSLAVQNAVATNPETDDYWNGGPTTFASRRVTYRADYNEYQSAPRTVYEGWALYNQHPQTDRALSETSPVNGKRIRLVTLAGQRSETSVAPVTVTAQPISVPEQTVTITNTSQPIRFTLDTQLSEAAWQETLAGEVCTDANNDNVCDDPASTGHIVDWDVVTGQLTVTLEKGETYELRLSKIAIGSQAPQEPPHYMTSVDAPQVVDPGGTEFTVEVRDKLNTAKSGVDVTWTVTGGTLSETQTTTNERGQTTVTVTPKSGPVTVVAEADLDGDGTIQDRERVRFPNLPVSDSPRDDASDINPNYDDGVILDRAVIGSTGSQGQRIYHVDVTWRNLDDADQRSVAAMRINFYSVDGQGRAATYEMRYADVFDVGDTTSVRLPIRGPYETQMRLDTIAASGTETYRFRFTAYNKQKKQEENFVPTDGDFFVVSIVWDDGTTSRYFIDPRTP